MLPLAPLNGGRSITKCSANKPSKLVREVDAFTHFATNDTAQQRTIMLGVFVVGMSLRTHTHTPATAQCTGNAQNHNNHKTNQDTHSGP